MSQKISLTQFKQDLLHTLVRYTDRGEAEMWVRMLVEHHTGMDHRQWMLNPSVKVSQTQVTAILKNVESLKEGRPIQYILGKAHFYGRDFYVNPSVLIPRRETEELMVWIRDSVKGEILSKDPLQILDIGTGSGCIPISLACEWEMMDYHPQITATDISPNALEVAKNNASKFGVNIQWMEADIFAMSEEDFSSLDMVISNPSLCQGKGKSRNVCPGD